MVTQTQFTTLCSTTMAFWRWIWPASKKPQDCPFCLLSAGSTEGRTPSILFQVHAPFFHPNFCQFLPLHSIDANHSMFLCSLCFHDLITTLTWLRVLTPNNGALVTWSSFDDFISVVKWVLFFSLNHWGTSGILGLLGFFRESVSYFYPVHWRMSVWGWNSLKTNHPAVMFHHLSKCLNFCLSDLIGKKFKQNVIVSNFSKLGESD